MRHARIVAAVSVALLLAALALVTVKPAFYLRTIYPLKYPNTIRVHARNYDLPPALVAAVIEQESDFDHRARSKAGAVGLMQLTPRTAQGIATRTGGTRFEMDDLLDPEISIRYGCWYLNHLHGQFDGDDGFVMTLAAYNAGQGRVREWAGRDADHVLEVGEIPYAETRSYVRHVLALRRSYEEAYPEL